MKPKTLDCVEMKRQGAVLVQVKLQGKTTNEQLEYWKLRTEELLQRQEKLKKSNDPYPSSEASSH
ncbi:MAG: hypothetical protein AB1656_10655 [Candidatus Omnitrophota bacterium]